LQSPTASVATKAVKSPAGWRWTFCSKRTAKVLWPWGAAKRLYRAITRANIGIHDKALTVPELSRMSTTMTAVAVEKGILSSRPRRRLPAAFDSSQSHLGRH